MIVVVVFVVVVVVVVVVGVVAVVAVVHLTFHVHYHLLFRTLNTGFSIKLWL